MPGKRSLIVAAAVVALGTTLLALSAATGSNPPQADPNAPNIVVVMTDDQNAGTVNRRTMPETTRLLKDHGVNFSNMIVTTPQCCPSRAAFFTGQYGHNNGVESNSDGYPALVGPANVLPMWLKQAGYSTAHVGRFLKDYAKSDTVGEAADPPPGWDQWAGVQGVRYFDFGISYDGVVAHYGHKPSDYATSVYTREAVGVVRQYAPEENPLFLSVAYIAPHKQRKFRSDTYCGGSIAPAPRDDGRFRHEPLPDVASMDEPDISDKPEFIQNNTQLDDKRAKTVRAYRCGLAALREVDRGVGRIYDAFEAAGEADNTVFIFTSDNGRFEGEHRLPGGKSFPYEEAIKVPLVVRLPKSLGEVDAGTTNDALVANIDLAPTIVDLARAEPCVGDHCRLMDGRSLLPILTGRSASWPDDRAVVIELREPPTDGEPRLPCEYQGVRTTVDFYVHYTAVRDAQGNCEPASVSEYYDLIKDPFELDNLASDPGSVMRLDELNSLLARLASCQGLPGRERISSAPYCE